MTLTIDDVMAIVKPHNDKLVAEARLSIALEALEAIRVGLQNTGSHRDQWMTRITKQEAHHIALAAIARAKGRA